MGYRSNRAEVRPKITGILDFDLAKADIESMVRKVHTAAVRCGRNEQLLGISV